MITVPTWVPIAAFTTVALTALIAAWITRRQEHAKAQAAAEVELRTLVIDLRADLVHARQELDRSSTYVSDPILGERLMDFTARAVGQAHKLSPARQRKIVAALIPLVGQWRVQLAEEIGPTWLRGTDTDPSSAETESSRAASLRTETQRLFVLSDRQQAALRADYPDDGLLGNLSKAQLPDAEHPQVIKAVDGLLAAAGGSHRLGQTRWAKLLRRDPLSVRR
ncbi:hypothetical protein ACIQ9R_36095 [Streptomyces sp. NPDC094447]|uniref:hypothetical protein n=1 Tax=Streptomyces sp. NPDC094447 TaxID=3366062 RepID=UPI0038158F96